MSVADWPPDGSCSPVLRNAASAALCWPPQLCWQTIWGHLLHAHLGTWTKTPFPHRCCLSLVGSTLCLLQSYKSLNLLPAHRLIPVVVETHQSSFIGKFHDDVGIILGDKVWTKKNSQVLMSIQKSYLIFFFLILSDVVNFPFKQGGKQCTSQDLDPQFLPQVWIPFIYLYCIY